MENSNVFNIHVIGARVKMEKDAEEEKNILRNSDETFRNVD